MDIFPIALSNRDMNTLMRVIEEWGLVEPVESIPDLPEFDNPDDIDEVKAKVSQMDARRMEYFLRKFEEGLEESLNILQRDVMQPRSLEYTDALQGLRGAKASVYNLRQRIRKPR